MRVAALIPVAFTALSVWAWAGHRNAYIALTWTLGTLGLWALWLVIVRHERGS